MTIAKFQPINNKVKSLKVVNSKAEKLVKSTGFYENGAVISVSDSSARLLTLLFTPLSPSLNVCHCERLNYVGVNKVGE